MKLNKKGQAFSTFKLLIAAIVAVAILAILIPIIMKAIGIIKADPLDETKKKLSNLVDQPGAVARTGPVAFAPGSVLAGSALAEKLPISKDQICMGTGQFPSGEDEEFEFMGNDEQNRIIFHGRSERNVNIAVVCNVNLTALLDDLDVYGLDEYDGSDIVDACEEIDGCEAGSKCCAVILERA